MDRREAFGALSIAGLAGLAGTVTGHDEKPAGAGPMSGPHAHFCGIHLAKKDPKFQIVTQHYCAAHSGEGADEMFQCVLFDSSGKNAKLLGVEYIISDAAYRRLPEVEKPLWHPHTYEVLAGGLVAPGMAAADESKFMKMILTTWGKAWHTWPDPKTPIPLGEPLLIWSATGDGQIDDRVVAVRDKEFGISTAKVREARVKEIGIPVPSIAQPKTMDAVGRQWTDSGEDKPGKVG